MMQSIRISGFRWLWLGFCGLLPVGLLAGPSVWSLHEGDRTQPVAVHTWNQMLYLAVDDLATFLGGQTRAAQRPDALWVLIDGIRIYLRAGGRVYDMNGQLRELRQPIRAWNNRWWVPLEWVQEVVPLIRGQPVHVLPNVREIWIGTIQGPRIRWQVDTQPALTRLQLFSQPPIPFQIATPPGEVRIILQAKRVYWQDGPPQYTDARIARITVHAERHRTLIIIHLQNPQQRADVYAPESGHLVVEIHGPTHPPAPNLPVPTAPASEAPADTVPVTPEEFTTVVIDPGHGGDETGTVGVDGVLEKDVTLAIALRLKRVLEDRLGLQVVLTRDRDVTMDLDARTAKANNVHADLFISIHANATPQGRATGVETYYLSTDWVDEETRRRLRASEPGAFQPAQQTAEASDALQLILWDMAQIAHLEESSLIAQLVQEELCRTLGIPNRGVKQAPFRVLIGANMPAVLVEVGFLDNPAEARRLLDATYQQQIAQAIARSIERYIQMRARRGQPKFPAGG